MTGAARSKHQEDFEQSSVRAQQCNEAQGRTLLSALAAAGASAPWIVSNALMGPGREALSSSS